MQNSFYASGFLYNNKTHQILLIQSDQKKDSSAFWSLLGGEGKRGEEAKVTFQRVVSKFLNINLKPKDIYPVYDYFHNTRNKLNFVFYGEVAGTKKFNSLKGSLSWFGFSETLKLPFTSQTKQDIIVGERVINAKWRDDEAKKALASADTSRQ